MRLRKILRPIRLLATSAFALGFPEQGLAGVLEILAPAVPYMSLAFPVGAGATVIMCVHSFSKARRERIDKLHSDLSSIDMAPLHELAQRDPVEVFDSRDGWTSVLNTLLVVDALVRRHSLCASPQNLEAGLSHPDFHSLRHAFLAAKHVVELVRNTSYPIQPRAWNGDRAKAFVNLERAIGI